MLIIDLKTLGTESIQTCQPAILIYRSSNFAYYHL